MDDWPTMDVNSLQSVMLSRLNQTMTHKKSGFDPYNVMLKRKHNNVSDEIDPVDFSVQPYDPVDIKELEEFCRRYNILNFNCGKMHPRAALQMLKNKIGIVQESTPNKKILHG